MELVIYGTFFLGFIVGMIVGFNVGSEHAYANENIAELKKVLPRPGQYRLW